MEILYDTYEIYTYIQLCYFLWVNIQRKAEYAKGCIILTVTFCSAFQSSNLNTCIWHPHFR